jgi:hypothetical protein
MPLFYHAGKQSGYVKLQLQLAAREAAARQLLDETGLDVRNHLERLTPAVLRSNPPVDATGKKYLKNEYENRLYYFLQVTEDDFLTQVSIRLSLLRNVHRCFLCSCSFLHSQWVVSR